MWEHWAEYSSIFLLSSIKYIFTPLFGWRIGGLSFMGIWMSCFAGAYITFNIFYWASSYFFRRAEKKRKLRKKPKKKFTRTNRIIVKMRRSKYGFFLVCFLCPMFLSVPGGTLVVAKFYGHRKDTFFYTSVYLFIWGGMLTAFWMMVRA